MDIASGWHVHELLGDALQGRRGGALPATTLIGRLAGRRGAPA